jgi:hypothetical protein
MKTKFTIIYLVMIGVAYSLNGCKKESPIDKPQDGKQYDVSFKVEGFTKEESPMGPVMSTKSQSTNTTSDNPSIVNAVDTYLTDLDYFLYNSAGDLIQYSHQDYMEEDIEPFSYYGYEHFALNAGNYKLIVVGSMGGCSFPDSARYQSAAIIPGRREDLFYKELAFTVDEAFNINQTITIERIVGSLEVNQREMVGALWGGKPLVSYTTARRFPFDEENQDYQLREENLPWISGDFIPYQTIDFVSRNFVLPDRTGNFNTKVKIEIRAIREGGFIATKTFDDIIVQPNVKVVLKGTLTGNRGQQLFEINADSAWQNTVVHEFRR